MNVDINIIDYDSRLVTARVASRYLGFKTTAVLKRIPIKPILFPGKSARYDIKAISCYLDRVSGLDSTAEPKVDAASEAQAAFDAWSQSHAA